MCDICVEGRRAKIQLTQLLEAGVYDNAEVEELKKKKFEVHYEIRQKQRE